MGLDERDSDGFRLRPDGKTLQIMIAATNAAQFELPLVKEYWDDVGVKTDFKQVDDAFYHTQFNAAQLDLHVWAGDRMTEGLWYALGWTEFDYSGRFSFAPLWKLWLMTDGKEGEEPPDDIKRIAEISDIWRTTTPGTEEYEQIAKEICDYFADHTYVIGTVGMTPYPLLLPINLGNYRGGLHSADNNAWVSKFPAQFFLK